MPTVMPKGDKIRQAVKWIAAERKENEKKSFNALVQDAAMRFNLSPTEEEYLISFYREKKEKIA